MAKKAYKNKDYFESPRFDFVGITTLFTFYFDITIQTINFAKRLCKDESNVMVGGIMASILPDKVYEETGIYPFVGQLDRPGIIDKNDKRIIDELPFLSRFDVKKMFIKTVKFNLYLNKVLSKIDLDKLKAFDSYTKDLSYALNLIGKYAYTKSKLKKKLIAKKIKDTNINMIMRYLEEHHLIDDLAFAISYADSLIKRRKGPLFIKERLKELGISEEDINKVINNIKTSYKGINLFLNLFICF